MAEGTENTENTNHGGTELFLHGAITQKLFVCSARAASSL